MKYLIKETKRVSYENRDYPPTYETVTYWGANGFCGADPKKVKPFDSYDAAAAVVRAMIQRLAWNTRNDYDFVYSHDIISIGG